MTEAPLDEIRAVIRSFEQREPDDLICTRLAGDASDRRYFRAAYSVEGLPKRLVVMDILDVQNICKSEEVTLYHDDTGELPFLNIHRFLESMGIPVPTVFVFNRETGIMLLEDLGDRLLLDEAIDGDTDTRRKLYEEAIDQLVFLQVESDKRRNGSGCMAFEQTFAVELLVWEFDHYLEYGIEALHDVTMAPVERKFLTTEFTAIAKRIAAMPRVFTHRDYHSRNLLVRSGRISLIDFQDALDGPLPYDLVSLLRDSYIDLGNELRDELFAYYVDRYAERSGRPLDPEAFRKDFDLVGMQRNLKAAGRFVFIDRVKGNPAYLESIPRTLSYVADDGKRNAELAPIFDILVRYEPRLRG